MAVEDVTGAHIGLLFWLMARMCGDIRALVVYFFCWWGWNMLNNRNIRYFYEVVASRVPNDFSGISNANVTKVVCFKMF